MGPLVGEAPQLGTLAMKTLQQHAVPEHFAYCPTMDLIALAVLENRVYVYRLNGQRVMGIGNRRADVQVKKLRWKPNGTEGIESTQSCRTKTDMSGQGSCLPWHGVMAQYASSTPIVVESCIR